MIFDDDDLAFSILHAATPQVCKNVLGLYEFWAPLTSVCVCEIIRVPKMDKKAVQAGAPKDSENLMIRLSIVIAF